ncbi:MAG TPA: MFS transporter [Syntrophobacteria bacterium]|nr:MFS transporter [Syntrophobacteria bacterium]
MRPDEEDVAYSGDSRWLALFCSARVGFSFIFTSYSAALPLLRGDWSMSAAQAGMVQSAWHLGYLVSLFTVGFLGDRFGAKRTYLWSAVAASASALVFAAFASSFVSGTVLYGLAGLCSGGSYTPGLTLIAERFPPATRGRAMGFYLAAGSLAYALSITVSSRLFPLGGWRLAFAVTCSLPTVGLALSLWALRRTPNIIHRAPPGARDLWRAIPAVLGNKPALLSMLAYTFHCWELLGMWAWLPAYLAAAALATAKGIDQQAAAVGVGVFLSGLTYLTSMLGSLVGGTLSDRWGRTLTMILFSCTSLVFSFTFGWMLGWPLAVLFLAAACYNFAGIADSSIYSTALTELVEPAHIGAAYAVRSVMGFGAGVISPWFFGLVMDMVRGVSPASERLVWGLAWASLGLGALPSPLMSWWLRRQAEATGMARGRR